MALRDELKLNNRKQPEQELKPAMNPLLQGIFNLLGGGLEGAIPNDPVIESLVKAGGFFKEQANDPFNYLGGGTVKGAKIALTPFMIARRKEIQQTLKTFDDDPILRGNEAVRTKLKKELDNINKTEIEDLRVDNQYKGFVKDPTTFGKTNDLSKIIIPPLSKDAMQAARVARGEVADATSKTGRRAPKQTEVPTAFTREIDDLATQIRRQEAAGGDPTSLFEEVPQDMVEDLIRELSRNKFQ
tara:strand:- start:1691 stop:2419 length:729 start_codon:yes stop_codon:yes gene_type:complete